MTGAPPRLEPGPDHPITVTPAGVRVTVRSGPVLVAETDRAVILSEASYPPVHYLPADDVRAGSLRPSETHTYCPYKGEASYFDLVAPDGTEATDAVWCYLDPYPAVAGIAGMVAFYPERVEITEGG